MNNEVETHYRDFVHSLVKSGDGIQNTLTPEKINLWHMATGVSGEAGELLDAIKKHVVYNKPLDLNNVIEELGDLEFYMEELRTILGLDIATIIIANMNKLGKRYASGTYSDKQAQDRRDKEV